MEGLLTTAELAEQWQVGQKWVQALCKSGRLRAELKGKTYLVRQRDADSFDRRSVGRPKTQKSLARNGRPKKQKSR